MIIRGSYGLFLVIEHNNFHVTSSCERAVVLISQHRVPQNLETLRLWSEAATTQGFWITKFCRTLCVVWFVCYVAIYPVVVLYLNLSVVFQKPVTNLGFKIHRLLDNKTTHSSFLLYNCIAKWILISFFNAHLFSFKNSVLIETI